MFHPLLNSNRLEILKEILSKKEIRKLEKRLDKLTRGLSKDALNTLNLLERLDAKSSDLEPYSIGRREVKIIRRIDRLDSMLKEIYREGVVGFDTEQRPTFKKGERQKPISIMQLATINYIYIIQIQKLRSLDAIAKIISDPGIIKVGFGLGNDSKELKKLLNCDVESLLDLSIVIKDGLKLKTSVGAKRAVSIFLNRKLQKSKNIVLSNWERDRLDSRQLKYATEDGTSPLDVFMEIRNNYPILNKRLPKIEISE